MDIITRALIAINDFIDDERLADKEPGGIILSLKQWDAALEDYTDHSNRISMDGGKPKMLGLRVILSMDGTGPMVVSKAFMAGMSWYPKLRLHLLGGR